MESDNRDRVIKTQNGPILARVEGDLLYAHSIPFAQAKRFQYPLRPEPWTNTRDCTKPGSICPQLPFRFEFVLGPMPIDRPMSEDCLTVSIRAPANATPGSRLPILVWYHGGANITGAADLNLMDTSDIARLGIVAVSVQYRLGIFGCLGIDDIAPKNIHVFDQIEALRWVNENAEAIGGDASQITIMGQSAGGGAIYNMLLADGTEDLYQRAILISAPLGLIHADSPEPEITGKRASVLLGGTTALAAEKSSAELLDVQKTLLEEQMQRGSIGVGFGPVWGASPLPKESEVEEKINQRAKQIDLFVGWTADDCLPFVTMHPTGRIVTQLPLIGSTIAFFAGRAATARVFKSGAQKLHNLWLKSGGKSTTFSFDWFPPGSPLRACHCIEMPFLFGGWATWAAAPLIAGKGSQEVVERLAPAVKRLFIEFMQHGLPLNEHVVFDERFSVEKYVKDVTK